MATMQATSNGTIPQKQDPEQQLRYNLIVLFSAHLLGDPFRVLTPLKSNIRN
jgi:hypothetical protein